MYRCSRRSSIDHISCCICNRHCSLRGQYGSSSWLSDDLKLCFWHPDLQVVPSRRFSRNAPDRRLEVHRHGHTHAQYPGRIDRRCRDLQTKSNLFRNAMYRCSRRSSVGRITRSISNRHFSLRRQYCSSSRLSDDLELRCWQHPNLQVVSSRGIF